jgi:hypothetical protein
MMAFSLDFNILRAGRGRFITGRNTGSYPGAEKAAVNNGVRDA